MRSEFEFIRNIKDKFGLSRVGDDCAVLPKDSETDLVITTDLLVEDIDFRLDWTTPEFLGHKALTASLSDVAAMGGTPRWTFLSIGVPDAIWNSDFLDRFYTGYHSNLKRSHAELVGGDLSRTPDKITVDSIVGGEVPRGRAILRSGAKVGDAIVVTSRLGGSAGGLRLLENGRRRSDRLESWERPLLAAHLEPYAQVGTGQYLQNLAVVNAMIDTSDGLAADLMHICEASGVGARLDSEKIPINLNLRHLTNSCDEQLKYALHGGEDFQLLFTLPANAVPQLSERMIGGDDQSVFTVIGEITSKSNEIELLRNGVSEKLEPIGFRHF